MKPILLLALLLVGCSPKPAEESKPTALVTTALVERGAAQDFITAYGAAEFLPTGEHGLTAPIEAVVASIPAPAGTQVRAGQPVVVLTPSPATRLEVDKANHEAEEADAAYARAQRLRATGLDSDADVETARATAASADETRRTMAARTGAALVLTAPAAGVVEAVALAQGDLAAAGVNVAKVGDPTALRARLGVEPSEIGAIRVGAPVRLGAAAEDVGREGSASVMAVDPRADAQTRLASVSVLLPPGLGFTPGAPVRGAILLRERTGAVLIPRAAVLYEQDRPYVFLAAGGTAHKVFVFLGAEQGDRVEVLRGVDPGARIVVEGASALEDGMTVREAAPVEPRS
jgi:RND family efflux transporter MFP subunit